MQGKKYYQPKLFTTFHLADKIPENNLYFRLKEALDLNFLREETRAYYGNKGQKSLDPIVFFKMTLVGYLENISSDRQLVDHCSMRLDIRYFLDYDIDEDLPWHSTISRTRQLFGRDIFKKVFEMVLKLCIDKGMVSGRRQAIDSALIKANASMDSLVSKEILEDGEDYIQGLQVDVVGQETSPKGIQKHIGSHYSEKNLSNNTHISLTDPDAKIAYKPGKPRRLNYLGQLSVDIEGHVITHIQADFADKKDGECLPEILNRTQENLKVHGLPLEQVVCDGNYSSSKVLKYLEENDIKGYIPNFGRYKGQRKGFIYQSNEDYYQCSQGKVLPFKGLKRTQRGYFKEYRSSTVDCKGCPLRKKCIGKGSQKQLLDTVDKPYFVRMEKRLRTRYAQHLKKRRQATVEPVLGSLIEYGGLKKIRTKGIQQADKCMLLAATAYNLKKWMKTTWKPYKSGAFSLKMNAINYLSILKQSFFSIRCCNT